MAVILTQDIELAWRAAGLDGAAVKDRARAFAPFLEALGRQRSEGALPLFGRLAETADLDAAAAAIARLKRFSTLLVLGTGGSSLGGETLCRLEPVSGVRVRFLDNVDPDQFAHITAVIDPRDTGVLAVSKSGGTIETLMQTALIADHFVRAVGLDGWRDRLVVLTEPGPRPLRDMAEAWGVPILDHETTVDGRFSALTLTGLVPAAVGGVDVIAARRGGRAVADQAFAAADAATVPAALAAATVLELERRGITQSVFMPYSDLLDRMSWWYRQIWGESLGKAHKGTTPIAGLGTVDLHSQLQLYLDGPKDKMVTVVGYRSTGLGPGVPATIGGVAMPELLVGHTVGDLMDAEMRATVDTLNGHGVPTRLWWVPKVDAEAVGAMMVETMLETLLVAHAYGIDPYGQPAVEDGKALAKRYLAARRAGAGEVA